MGLPPSKQVIFKDLASGWERWEFRFGWELLRSWEGGGGRGEESSRKRTPYCLPTCAPPGSF